MSNRTNSKVVTEDGRYHYHLTAVGNKFKIFRLDSRNTTAEFGEDMGDYNNGEETDRAMKSLVNPQD